MSKAERALLVIDIQNDYFADGKFPLWNAQGVLDACLAAIAAAKAKGVAVVLVRHVSGAAAPFFQEGSAGAELRPEILAAAPDAPIVVKRHADAFHLTDLDKVLQDMGVRELLICGMMTQNCVTHTVLSKAAEKYAVAVLPDCCATVSEILHKIALNALSTRVRLAPSGEAI